MQTADKHQPQYFIISRISKLCGLSTPMCLPSRYTEQRKDFVTKFKINLKNVSSIKDNIKGYTTQNCGNNVNIKQNINVSC